MTDSSKALSQRHRPKDAPKHKRIAALLLLALAIPGGIWWLQRPIPLPDRYHEVVLEVQGMT